ncbi:MAG: hypothetical protein ACR2MQ_11065 [Gemmatimonadaceae bacterium]
MAYIGVATSLIRRGELRVPTGVWNRPDSTSALSLWPPGYPMLMAGPIWAGASPIQSARWVNIVAASVTAATIVLLVGSAAGTGAGAVAALVVFATQSVFDVHLSVLSEPVFLALIVGTLAAMTVARDRLLLLGLLATAAVMVRYAGAAVPAAVVTWTLLDERYDYGRRFRRAMVVALVPAVVIAGWLFRTALAHDRHATPELSVYGGWSTTVHQAGDTALNWLAPGLNNSALQIAIAILAAVAIVVYITATVRETAGSRRRQLRQGRVGMLIGAAMMLSFWYVAMLVGSRTFVGGTIPFDGRILAPLMMLVEIATVTGIAYWWRAYHRPMRLAIGLLGAVWLVAAALVTENDAVYAVTEGSDFASGSWRNSPLVGWVRAHGNGRILYSNWPPAVYFHAGRIARQLPDSSDPGDMAGFLKALRANGGYVVGFDAHSPDVIAPAELARRLSLHEVARTTDGAVWDAAGNSGQQ